MTNTYYFDMDGVIANFHKAYATNKGTALSHKAMADLEPFTEAVNLVKALIKGGSTVYINSLAANENGKAGKLPNDKLVTGSSAPAKTSGESMDGFLSIPDGMDEELPF